jgi:predicted porin
MKKLIAAAVAAAVIIPATTMAGSTLYGKIHMSVSYIDNDRNKARDLDGIKIWDDYSEMNIASNSSRIGVKGSEDLGNGLKLGYLMEWSVGMDGGSDLGQRNRYITLGGNWGTGLLGKVDTPMKTLGRKVDLFGERAGDTRNLMNSASITDVRANNVIAYISPNFSGFTGTVAYVTDASNATGDDNDNDAVSASAIYANGPLLVGGAFVNYSKDNFVTTDKYTNEQDWRLASSYKIGAFKLVGSWTNVKNGMGIKKNYTDEGLRINKDNDYMVWTLGGAYDFGNNTVKAQWTNKDEGAFKKDGANLWAIGLEHKMSKRTMVYVDYGQLNNDKGANIALMSKEGNGTGTPKGGFDSNPYSFGLGIIHKF